MQKLIVRRRIGAQQNTTLPRFLVSFDSLNDAPRLQSEVGIACAGRDTPQNREDASISDTLKSARDEPAEQRPVRPLETALQQVGKIRYGAAIIHIIESRQQRAACCRLRTGESLPKGRETVRVYGSQGARRRLAQQCRLSREERDVPHRVGRKQAQ